MRMIWNKGHRIRASDKNLGRLWEQLWEICITHKGGQAGNPQNHAPHEEPKK